MKKVLFVLIGLLLFVACEKKEPPCIVATVGAQYLSSSISTALECKNVDILYNDILSKTVKLCDIGRTDTKALPTAVSMFCPMFATILVGMLQEQGAITKYDCQLEVLQKILANPTKICTILNK